MTKRNQPKNQALEFECLATLEIESPWRALPRFFYRGRKIDASSQHNIIRALRYMGLEFSFSEIHNAVFAKVGDWDTTIFDQEMLKHLWLRVDRQFGFRPPFKLFCMVFQDFARRSAV